MLALIDADIVCHRVGFTTENDDFEIARFRCDEMLDNILIETGATSFQLWLSDTRENNFRYHLTKSYKANRTAPKPKHLEAIKEYLIVQWKARIAHGEEADDALGIEQCNAVTGKTIICSIDKDLMQIPGDHWNFVKKEHKNVSEKEGLRTFYRQLLVGDTSDNIEGCSGIGPVKAGKAIGDLDDPMTLLRVCFDLYKKQESDIKSEEEIIKHILLAGKLLKIRTKPEEIWHFPVLSLTEEWM